MENWKNTKCGTCAIQRQKPICNSCMNYHFYRPMTNAQKIRSMTDEELAELFAEKCNIGKEFAVCWLQSEVEGVTENE